MDEFSGKDSLLGKITHYFDIGSSTKTPKNVRELDSKCYHHR